MFVAIKFYCNSFVVDTFFGKVNTTIHNIQPDKIHDRILKTQSMILDKQSKLQNLQIFQISYAVYFLYAHNIITQLKCDLSVYMRRKE